MFASGMWNMGLFYTFFFLGLTVGVWWRSGMEELIGEVEESEE